MESVSLDQFIFRNDNIYDIMIDTHYYQLFH